MQEMVTLHSIHIKCHIKGKAALTGDQISGKLEVLKQLLTTIAHSLMLNVIKLYLQTLPLFP